MISEDLKSKIGQALSDEIASGAETPDWSDSREIDRLVESVAKVIEPFLLKPQVRTYGIEDNYTIVQLIFEILQLSFLLYLVSYLLTQCKDN